MKYHIVKIEDHYSNVSTLCGYWLIRRHWTPGRKNPTGLCKHCERIMKKQESKP